MASLDPTDLVDLYWAGRTSLISRRDDIPVYDEVFRSFFLAAGSPVQELLKIKARADAEAETSLEVPATEPSEREPEEETILGLMASNVETLKRKSFASCTPEELEALRRIMARMRLTPPRRRSRRTKTAPAGRQPDLRRTIRESLRTHGEMVNLYWRRRRVRLRPLTLILDISGSMADYSRALLQFAYSAKQASAKVEVFCFGTRLTCITKPLQTRSPDDALQRAAELVVDWEGGTRIGDSLDAFVRGWARRGTCRGGIVVICSDGLDRGDPEVLATAMERLSRLCHKIVWMNPHKGDDPDYRPQTVGMMVAYPHIDLLLSGHDLRSLEEFAELLPRLG
ncbi:VWA domain-containing protein [Carbonactinospora thermoautotrophica]|nr:VWA domain-containing protein [Carbonactinospora thermoautotrophica]